MLTDQEREFHRRRLNHRRRAGIFIVANALAYYTGHLIGRGFSLINDYAHKPHHFHPFGG